MDSYPYHHQQNQPPPPASYYNHAPPPPPPQQPYNYPYPPQPYNYPPPPHHPQLYAPPPPPPLHHNQYPPPARSHFPPPHLPPPGAPTAYSHPPPPDQWGNASWQRHQGWDYSERNDPYNNKEDWASKAKEWATTKVGTETVHAHSHSHFTPVEDNRYAYHNQFQQPNQQLSNQQLHAVDPLNQTTYTHGAGSYATGYNAGSETIKAKASDVAPSEKNYGSTTSSIYEQEVSYSYSSAPGHQDSMHQTQSSHVPMPAHFPAIQESFHSESLPPPVVAGEQPHLSNHGPASFMPDVCDRPLDFLSTHKPEYEPRQNADFAPMSSSVHTWTTQIPLGSAAPFDPAYVPQASIPLHAPNFQSSMPPVSAASSYAFNADPSVNMNFSERPKKATVPNWLREEIIKNKPVIPSMASALLAENSINSVGSEDGDNSIKRVDQGDNKSIDSIKSTEDEDDEEVDVEAARTAALNQEIKRVLTEILLKVTDELFDEIATKVLDEEQQTIGEDSSINGNQKASVPTTTTQKASAKVLIPYSTGSSQADNGEENTSTSSPGGNLLGLATYASDDEDEIQSSKVVSSENGKSVYEHQESKHDNKQVKDGTDNGSAVRKANSVAKTIISSVESLSHIEKASLATKSNIDGNKRDIDEPLTKDDNRSNNSLSRGDKRSSIEKISRENSVARDSVTHLDKNRPKEKQDKDKSKKKEDNNKTERRSNMKESDHGRSSKHGSNGNDKEDRIKDKRDRHEDGEKKRERIKDEKEEQSKRAKESAKYNHKRSLSPSSRGKNSKDKSFSRNSASGDEPSDNSKKRSKQSHNSSLSPSPTRSRKRQNSRSPHSRHSHRRHSPFSSTERRRR